MPAKTTKSSSRGGLMIRLAQIRDQLRQFGIRDASDYAEILIAEAVEGQRVTSRVNKGHDVISSRFGRVEVKCRQLPPDGRIEERVEIGHAKKDGFEHLAVVIFLPNFRVKVAAIVPYDSVWRAVELSGYRRITCSRFCKLEGVIDLTSQVIAAAQQ